MGSLLDILSALAEPTRLAALRLVWNNLGEPCVCEIMDDLHITQSRASRHMAVLRNAGLVLDRRDGQWTRYRRNPELDEELVRMVQGVLDVMPEGGVVPSKKLHLTKAGCRSGKC